ncbi:MAG: hypothetical protein Q4G46_11885 [Propionibacteriaceae bacterium]|nr:hypothetical protein [Propionibacteriaceae bacterium]
MAVAEADGPHEGLAALEGIDMATSHRPMVVRAELLARTGATGEALVVLDEALRHCRNDAERLHLER